MARMTRFNRAHSHEGVTAGYYNNSDPDEEGESFFNFAEYHLF